MALKVTDDNVLETDLSEQNTDDENNFDLTTLSQSCQKKYADFKNFHEEFQKQYNKKDPCKQ